MNFPNPASDPKERELFVQALEQPTDRERAAFLAGACGDDIALRGRVEALLARSEGLGEFLEQPVASLAALGANFAAGTLIGRYKLLQKIGEGGMGLVYMAEQEEPVRRRVALKIIKLGMDTKQVIARFEAERQALALMDHLNIAKVLDAGATDTGRPYFVMELIQGVPITEFCDKNRLSAEERVKLFLPVCQAIQSAHQKGIIHRDLKPTNILVTLNAGVPHPMVIDFGVAKATNQKLTEKTVFTNYATMIGTPAYMSPEQAEMSRLDVDTRADIYGLGVLLYELLTGTTPFPEKRLRSVGYNEMQRIIMEEEPERPSTRLRKTSVKQKLTEETKDSFPTSLSRRSLAAKADALSIDLDCIVMKCLEKDRSRRYETANGLALDLQRHLDNEPVVARPPSAAYRVQKFVRRNRGMVTAAATIVAVLVLGIFVSTWQAIRAMRAEREQSHLREAAQTAQASESQQRKRAEADERSAQQSLYVANMNLARQAWEDNNFGRLRQLLEETENNSARGFEWYYWQRQLHLELMTLRGHRAGISSVAFSPDGQRIVTGSFDGTAQIWDASSGKPLRTFKGHNPFIHSVAFSPDGGRIATASRDAVVWVWDAASGKDLFALYGHTGSISSVAFSSDGRRIVTGSVDGTVKVWDAASGTNLLTINGHSEEVNSVAVSPDGQRIVMGTWTKAVVFEAATGKELLALIGHSNDVTSVAFSPDGLRVLTGSSDGTAKVWQTLTGSNLLTLNGNGAGLLSVAFSPDGQRIVTGSWDKTAKVWDAESGTQLLTLKGHTADVTAVAFAPNGQRIVTGSEDGTAKVWEAENSKEVLTLKGHSLWIWSVAFSPDGKSIVTGSQDQTAKIWDTASGKDRLTIRDSNSIWSVAFSPDSRRIVTGGTEGTAKVWDAANGSQLLALQGHTRWIRAVAFSPNGQLIVTGSADRTAKVWDAASGTILLTLKGHSSYVLSVAFSPDSGRIVTGSFDSTAKVWDTATGKELLTLEGHTSSIQSVAFSPDGRYIVTGSNDGTAKVWDANSGKKLFTLIGHGGNIHSVAFSPDGQRILTGSRDGTAKLWEAGSGRDLLTLKGHGDWILSVAFSPDGHQIVTGGWDRTAKLWVAAAPQQVAVWQREEKADTERPPVLNGRGLNEESLAEHERSLRSLDPGAIKEWLVLAPIAFEGRTDEAALRALDQEQLPQEAGLRARAGDRVTVGASELVWKGVQLEDYLIDFNHLSGKATTWSAAYAICYIQSEAVRTGLLMKVSSNGQAKIYLNGNQIYRNDRRRPYEPDQDVLEGVELKAGVNVLVFKVVNEEHDWQGSVWLTDAAGQPVKGIRVTLTPP